MLNLRRAQLFLPPTISSSNPASKHMLPKRTTSIALLALLSAPLFAYSSLAETPAETREQITSIESLGQLYGIALPCNYIQQTRRIKSAMVAALPKKRYLGQVFEEATNESFLAFHKTGGQCPGKAALATQINARIETLNSAFKN